MSDPTITELQEVYHKACNEESNFMDFLQMLHDWIKTNSMNQLEVMNYLRNYFPIYFVASPIKLSQTAKLLWRDKPVKYNLIIILPYSRDIQECVTFITQECLKYGLDYNNKDLCKINEKKLLDSGFLYLSDVNEVKAIAGNNNVDFKIKTEITDVVLEYEKCKITGNNFHVVSTIIYWAVDNSLDLKTAATELAKHIPIKLYAVHETGGLEPRWLGKRKKYLLGMRLLNDDDDIEGADDLLETGIMININ